MDNVTYGLVLSGGGVKGAAHIGVIKALEEHGIVPSVVAGASAGAVVGALYSAGYSINEMLDFFRKSTLFSVRNYAVGKPGIIDSDKFYSQFKSYFEKDSFEDLKKKFYVSATDMLSGRTKYFHQGKLIQALLASAAVPGVFSPVIIDGRIYSDGGVANNFPIEPLVTDCDKIIGVHVHPLKKISIENLKTSYAILERAYMISRVSSSMQKFAECDLLIAPESLNRYGTFNMSQTDEIFEVGYQAAIEKLKNNTNLGR